MVCAALCGCSQTAPPPPPAAPVSPHEQAQLQNQLFLSQKTFDPFVLELHGGPTSLPGYIGSGSSGSIVSASGSRITTTQFPAGNYKNGLLVPASVADKVIPGKPITDFTLDMRSGTLIIAKSSWLTSTINWKKVWNDSDIVISGDQEAQQVAHADLFYLISSTNAGSNHSIPPMGLSSQAYGGHIFWDAEVWMFPALAAQHPDLAKSIVDYRFARLSQAKKNAASVHLPGAMYPWESADSGKEEAPQEFAQERHVTADVAYAAWQYYLWTGDKGYLAREGWPILSATAQYWAAKARKGTDGNYHIANVLPADETAGVVTDDAWTNGIAAYNLSAASAAARVLGKQPDPLWSAIAGAMYLPLDRAAGYYVEYAGATSRLQAKQADTQMLIYPLQVPMAQSVAQNTLDNCLTHTEQFGPAMTSSINSIVASMLGRKQQSLDLFRDSYRPFERGPFDAFSVKRTTSNVYFCTGMGGCLQSIIYGFAGLNLAQGTAGHGTLIAHSGDCSLYANPHLPPGWQELTLKGVHFRGASYDIAISGGNSVKTTKVKV